MLSIEQITPHLTWQLRRDILYPDRYKHDMEMEEDNYGYHFGAFLDGKLVGVVSLFKHAHDWQFRKLAISDEVQKQGIGTRLLDYITGFVAQEGGTAIWCNARLSATGFYKKTGYAIDGEPFTKNDIEYVVMQRQIA